MDAISRNTAIALVTGGSRGIGKAIALRLARQSAGLVFVNYLQNDAAAQETKALIEAAGGKARLLKFNLAFPGEVEAMFQEIRQHTDRLDYMVHCAALTAFKPLHTVRPNQWDLTLNVNARAFLLCVQGCLPLMPAGTIVAISSTGSRRFNPNYGAMGATKAALENMVRYLAVELAPKNIRVNGVTAGLVDTESLAHFPDPQQLIAETLRRTPAGRIGTPDDVAKTVLFLLEDADWMYGQNIVLDGGFCLT